MCVKNYKFILTIILPAIVLICLFIWFEPQEEINTGIFSESGEWDLRGLKFDYYGCDLYGPVEYIANALLTPEEFSARETEAEVGYPRGHELYDISQYVDSQYATSRIRILLPDNGYYTFTRRSIGYSCRIYVNGEWIIDIGNPGETKESTVNDMGKISLMLKAENGVIEIIQQSSNFVHRAGRDHTSWSLSKQTIRSSIAGDFRESVKLGCFITLFFVHIIVFMLMRTYKANLYFALFCLMWFFRTGVIESSIFTDIFTWLPWTVKFRIEYIAFPVTAVLIVSLLNVLFPGTLQKWFMYALYGISSAIAILFLFADTLFMSYALLWCESIYIPAILYIIVRFIIKLKGLNYEQLVFLISVCVFFLAAIHDMLYYNDLLPLIFFPSKEISSISMLLFTICGTTVLFVSTGRKMKSSALENAALKEKVRLASLNLDFQREQYTRFMENAEQTKRAQHDLRHQLAVIGRLSNDDNAENVKEYVKKLIGTLPKAAETVYCENYAVNAVISHYIAIAEAEGISTDICLEVPEDTGMMLTTDFCVLMGNLLENAVDACLRAANNDKFLYMRSNIHAKYLTVIIENGFDGVWTEENGVYLSRKNKDGGIFRKSMGISSVQTICDKYEGAVQIEINGYSWKASACVNMGKKSDVL